MQILKKSALWSRQIGKYLTLHIYIYIYLYTISHLFSILQIHSFAETNNPYPLLDQRVHLGNKILSPPKPLLRFITSLLLKHIDQLFTTQVS